MNVMAQVLMNGLVSGSVYALVAVGFALSFGVLRRVNFAHGATCITGAYAGYFLITQLAFPFWAALVGAAVVGALVGILVERIAFRPFHRAPALLAMVSSLACALILENGLAATFGEQARSFRVGISERLLVPGLGVSLTRVQLVILGVSLLVGAMLFVFVRKTTLGRQTIAVSDDTEAAATWGINGLRVTSITFMLSSATAAVAGCLNAFDLDLDPHMGTVMLFRGFTANVIFGVGSLPGAILGGLLLGVIENGVTAFASSQYKSACTFVVLITLLLFRPHGVLGLRNRRFS